MKISEMLGALAAGEKIQQQDQSTQEPGPWKYVSPYGCMLAISRVAASWGAAFAPTNDYLSVDLPMYRRTPPADKVVYRCTNSVGSPPRCGWWDDYDVKQHLTRPDTEQFKLTYDGESGKLKKVELA